MCLNIINDKLFILEVSTLQEPRKTNTSIDDMTGDHPIFLTLAAAIPLLKTLLPFDSMIAITDNEKFLYCSQGEKVDSGTGRGDPISVRSGLYQCQQIGQKIVISLPKEVYGVPVKTTSVPIRDSDAKIIGALSIGLLGYIYEPDTIIAESMAMRKVLHMAHQVAHSDSTAMLNGESGTGKEVVAKYIHRDSKRSKGPFIAINCAALPEQLIESELFGYKKGAFTGANTDKPGLVEAAHGGTLFLDEIGELPLMLQSKILRALETSEIRRVGCTKDRKIDFRLVAATHRDLKQMVGEGKFRMDLYYRLNVIPIRIPPLRERPEDIVMLARKFQEDFRRKYDVNNELDMETLNSFLKYDWPGNVRELRNEVERRIITGAADLTEDLSPENFSHKDLFELFGLTGKLNEVMPKIEEQYIKAVLKKCNGRINKAAAQLGISRMGLYKKMRRLQIQK